MPNNNKKIDLENWEDQIPGTLHYNEIKELKNFINKLLELQYQDGYKDGKNDHKPL